MDIISFLGRLHPLIVHLPIGFLLIAFLIDLFFKGKKRKSLKSGVLFILVLGFLSSVGASVLGWLLSWEGGYESDVLQLHKIFGIITAVFALVALWSRFFDKDKVYATSALVIITLISLTGHYGGVLTHGATYLTEPLMSPQEENDEESSLASSDSIKLYEHLITPIFEEKCYSCHNDGKMKGGLNLTSLAHLAEGGDSGHYLFTKTWDNEIFQRVILPKSDVKLMPPKGERLTYQEMALLKYWIETAKGEELVLSADNTSDEIQFVLLDQYNLDLTPKPLYEKIKVTKISDENYQDLRQAGWNPKMLSEENHLIEMTPISPKKRPSFQTIIDLGIQDNIYKFNLNNFNVTEEELGVIAQCNHLMYLNLANNNIDDSHLKKISNLTHLEILNIHRNAITDETLALLSKMPLLKKVYAWQTQITKEKAAEVASKTKLTINTGI
ncbi:DUF2231 domain-containing protein [Wenyingzhuangia sp. IMCC45574]